MVKVLHIIDSLRQGGAEKIVKELIEHQPDVDSPDYEHHLFVLRSAQPQYPFDPLRTEVMKSFTRYSFAPLARLTSRITDENFRILHCHLLRSKAFGWWLKRRRFPDRILVREFLGLEYELVHAESARTTIRCPGSEGTLSLGEGLFACLEADCLTPASLPREPLQEWDLGEFGSGVAPIPVLYGSPFEGRRFTAREGATIEVGADIVGSAFFLLTRCEEYVSPVRDAHGRFPAYASLARRAGFLHRPIVNVYLEVLWRLLQLLWPHLQRKRRNYQVLLSHDVDSPFVVSNQSVLRNALAVGEDLLKRQDLLLACSRIHSLLRTRVKRPRGDIANTFDFLMTCSERRGLRSCFNFFCAASPGAHDPVYELECEFITELMRRVPSRGHLIGFHPSYDSYCDFARIADEFSRLRRHCEALGIVQDAWGGRQHYLRWKVPETWRYWDKAGLQYDSTLGFADEIGFRAGVCYDYPVYDLEQRTTLSLREIPLLVMDATLFKYMGLNGKQAIEAAVGVADECKRVNGTFTLLWHNNNLISREQRDVYQSIVNQVTGE